jgi:hypothetical protein
MIENNVPSYVTCPDCDAPDIPSPPLSESDRLSRREFLRTVGATVGGIVLAGATGGVLSAHAQNAPGVRAATLTGKTAKAETLVKVLYDSLTPKQHELVCMAWDHPNRSKVQANWGIVKSPISDVFSADQKEMIKGILRGVTTEEWYPKVLDQMQNDANGLGNYYVGLFGNPSEGKFEWVITGRHVTLRADGHSNANAAFGGPVFYGHAIKDTEDPGHPRNIYWHQARKANAVFGSFDGKQRNIALLDKAPEESKIKLQGAKGAFPGIAIGELAKDQKKMVESVMRDLLAPYRPSDADEVMADIKANGGLDKIHLSFYKQDTRENDGTWDIWRLEGPSLVWHFRGAPHVHTWVNVAKDPLTADAHT